MANFRTTVSKTKSGNFQVRAVPVDAPRYTIKTVGKNDAMWVEVPNSDGVTTSQKLLRGRMLARWIAEDAKQKYNAERFGGFKRTSKSLNEIKEDYLQHLRRKNLSHNHILHSEIDIRRAFEHLSVARLEDIDKEKIKDWIDAMMEDDFAIHTIRGRLSGFRGFLAWAVQEKIVRFSPSIITELMPEEENVEPKFYTAEEYFKLLLAAERVSPDLATMITLAHGSGLRKCEIVGRTNRDSGVLYEDINWLPDGQAAIYLRKEITKGCKSRAVPLSSETIIRLTRGKTGPIVPLRRYRADYLFAEARKLAGINLELTLHGLRHTFAKNRLQYGNCSLAEVQDLLGHSDPKTTRIYAQFEKSHYSIGTKNVDQWLSQKKTELAQGLVGQQ